MIRTTTVVSVMASITVLGSAVSSAHAGGEVLWDNGPFINEPGGGPNGSDASQLQNESLGMSVLGHGYLDGFGDNFTVDGDGWTIGTMEFFGYQLDVEDNESTFTEAYVQIYDGHPDQGGQVIWGDMTTNIMQSTEWTGAYRTTETNPDSTDRPIMSVVADADGLELEPGEYWVHWLLDGELQDTAAIPITINGQGKTGDTLRLWPSGSWLGLSDAGYDQGIPFVIYGPDEAIPGDVDGNGVVNVEDLLTLLGDWGACDDPDDCPSDIDGDGSVGINDLLTLLGNWG